MNALEGAHLLFAADAGRAHNDDAYNEVFLTHYQRIVAVLSRLLDNRARAEEVASEVFWRAYRGTVRWDGGLGGWLYRTATNLGIEELRSRARRERYEQTAVQREGSVDSQTPLEGLLNAERTVRVRSVLAALKTWQARILVLRSSGLSYLEVAEAMRIKASSVGTMVARAEAQFRRQYIQMYGAEE